MNAPGLRWALVLSLAAHAVLFVLFSVAARDFMVTVPRDVYRVSLVAPDEMQKWEVRKPAPPPSGPGEETAGTMDFSEMREEAVSRVYIANSVRSIAEKKEAERYRRERLEEIERASRVRGIARSAAERYKEDMVGDGVGEAAAAAVLDAYWKRVKAAIYSVWVYSDIDNVRGLRAEVSARILEDGSIVVKRLEKSSGNTLFDRSVLKAIKKASPVEPPPLGADMDNVVIKFEPQIEE